MKNLNQLNNHEILTAEGPSENIRRMSVTKAMFWT